MGIMSALFGKGTSASEPARETVFGDMPLDEWPADGAASVQFPWDAFVEARARLAAGDRAAASAGWRRIIERPGLEPRHYLQAWHFLREHGEEVPADAAKDLLGVVVEVSLPHGFDLLAAYPDYSARYYNHSGAGVVWDHPDTSLNHAIDELLAPSRDVVKAIGPWQGRRPASPPVGNARLSFLTPSGLHFGEGPIKAFSDDSAAGVVFSRATTLLKGLVGKAVTR